MRRSLTVYWCTCACPTSYLKESRSLVRKIISPPFSFDVQILLHHLGDPQVAERLARGLHRGGRGVFPGLSARPDHVDYPVHAHGILLVWRPDRVLGGDRAAVWQVIDLLLLYPGPART
jgi:hypothetical protein